MITETEEQTKTTSGAAQNESTASVSGNQFHGEKRPASIASDSWDDSEPEVSGFKKYRVPVLVGVILAAGVGYIAKTMSKQAASASVEKRDTPMHVAINLPPPPPPPPLPPPPQQGQEKKEEMIEEVKQDEAQPEPVAQVETALKGSGNSGMSLKSGNGSGVFKGGNGMSAERLRWSTYAAQVKSRVSQALESHPKTRKARSSSVTAHVWLDESGRITRVKLNGTTADGGVDSAISSEVLPGLQLSSPPPVGMPMPINMRINIKRKE